MKNTPTLSTIALSLVLAAAASTTAIVAVPGVAYAAAKAPTLSAKLYKPIKEIGELLDKNQFQEALAKTLEAAKIPDKTPFETDVVEDYLGRAYLGLQDYGNAAAAFDAAYATGAMPADAKESRIKVTTQLYLQAENYPKAIEFGNHYLQEVGPDPEILELIGQAQYMNKQLKPAGETLRQAVALAEQKNMPVKEEWLHYIEHAEAKSGNLTGVIAAEKMVVERFPAKENWSSLLTNFANNIKGSDKITLDIYRLMLATDTLRNSAEYGEMAKLAMQEQLPADAKRALQKGFDSGALTRNSKSEYSDLLAKATAAAAADQSTIAKGAAEASAQKTGDAQVKFGEAYASYGEYDKAIDLIKGGIAKGVKDPEDAQVRLGLAYLGAGRTADAIAAFKVPTSNSPAAQVSQLWAAYAAHPPQ